MARQEPSNLGHAAAQQTYEVLTPERVTLRYDIAGIGSRGAAVLLDTLLQVGLAALLLLAVISLVFGYGVIRGIFEEIQILEDLASSDVTYFVFFALFIVGMFTIAAGYFMVFEIVWNGQTPGKRVVGLRVIRENGYPIRATDSVIRNLVRIIDSLPTAYALGVTVMLFNARSRRLGDFAAGTIVVREGSRQMVTLDTLSSDSPSTARLSAADATLVRDFLLRRASMDAAARAALATRLADTLARRYQLTFEGEPEHFLETLT